jgi:hypothetical protein
MSKKPKARASAHPATVPPRPAFRFGEENDQVQQFTNACLAALERADPLALRLIASAGVFGAHDIEQYRAAVDTLWDSAGWEARARASANREEMEDERVDGSIDAAFILGIAVGRRLGPGALAPAGGAR